MTGTVTRGSGQPDVVAQLEQAEDRPLLFSARKLLERPGQTAPGADDGSTTRAVVPVGRRMQCEVRSRAVGEPDEEPYDQEPIVDDGPVLRRQCSGPLIGEIGGVDRREAGS